MKQLFVTFNTKGKKKSERKDIFLCHERKEEKIDTYDNSKLITIAEKHSNNIFNTICSVASTTTTSSIDSKKTPFNNVFPEQQAISTNISFNSNTNANYSNTNKFLGKKILFNIDKNEDIKEININNFNTFNNSNSQSLDGTMTNKETQKIDSMEIIEEKSDSNDTDIKIKPEKNLDELFSLNTGRWSYKEHLKFIEAIAEYGKNWKEVQKYIGSRSSAQARSHAQKFFLKLKMIKNSKFIFDYKYKQINGLTDIIDILKQKDEYAKDGKDYIIKTLINLSESISREYFINTKHFKKRIKKEKEKNLKREKIIFNNNKQLKFGILKTKNNYNYNNKIKKGRANKKFYIKSEKKKKVENIIENKDKDIEKNNNLNEVKINTSNNNINTINNYNSINIMNNENIINNKNKNNDFQKEKEETQEKNNIENNDKNICSKVEEDAKKFEKEENKNKYIEKVKLKNYIIDEGIMLFFENQDMFNYDNISLKIKEFNYMKNCELLNNLYNKYFFS